MRRKLRYSATAFVILPPHSLAGELACSWFTETAIALLMLISTLGCSSENLAHPGSKIADKIMYTQLSEEALQGNNLRHTYSQQRAGLDSLASSGPFQPE